VGETAAKETTVGETPEEETAVGETAAEEITAEAAAVEKSTEEEASAATDGKFNPEDSSAVSDEKTSAADMEDLPAEENQDDASGVEHVTAKDSSIPVWMFIFLLAAVALGAEVCRRKRQEAGAGK
jgi:hypothetical protein